MDTSIKNVAVCFSGQARTWRTAKENIIKYYNFGQNVNVDFFIHTWDINQYRYKHNIDWHRTNEKVLPTELEDLKNFFNPKDIELEYYNENDYLNVWRSLFYSFKKSIWLKRKYEIKNDFRYDLVIKSRLDINYQQEGLCDFKYPCSRFYINHPIENMVAYSNSHISKFPKEFNYHCFDDVTFYANSPTMDIIANCYDWIDDIITYEKNVFFNREFVKNHAYFYGPGTLLYKYLVDCGIHTEHIRTIYYYVVRKEVEDLGLDGIENWKDIRDFSTEWYAAILNNKYDTDVLAKYKPKLI